MKTNALVERREKLLGPGNPLFYDDPVHLVRGDGVWLYDANGKRYLDCYNNVPCVGHCHPKVVEALCQQAAKLNTHTRYLHENILDYAELLLGKFDDSLNRVAFACTGSEANDLAMRIARANSGGEGFICTNATYHGNTTAVAQLSSIFEPIGGYGRNVQMVPWPDAYRIPSESTADVLTDFYVDKVRAAIAAFKADGISVAGILLCPIFANEGLPAVPDGFMQRAIELVREAGGYYIADEVQSGFGRTGDWWGHSASGVVPDILTLGKPMGGGHPISAVVAKGSLLDNYRQQEMYFNTFGGNPVSCAVGQAVVEVIDAEGLVENAKDVGAYVLDRFTDLQSKHEIVGDVRGRGLFFGIDLVKDRGTKEPAPHAAKYVVNKMRDSGVLMSKIGQHDNVLKLRPPLCFSKDNADLLVNTLDDHLAAA